LEEIVRELDADLDRLPGVGVGSIHEGIEAINSFKINSGGYYVVAGENIQQ
jgi:hypothetical protein